MGGGAQQLQCKSESVQCSEKQQSPCEGDGGGLKFEKKKQSPHLRKKRAYFVLFHCQPNNIGPARQQPTDWGSLNFSESGRRRKGGGAQLLLISFATTILHEICNGSIKGMEDGGGAHTPAPQPWDWG